MKDLKNLKVAIVHDWLVGGGAELVILELHHMFPDAPIYTSYATDEWRSRLDNKAVTGYLQQWPFSKLRKYLTIFRIWWFTHLDLSGYDVVISSSGNGEAKGVRVPKGTVHICYCHSPTHFYWRHYQQYLKHPGFRLFDPLARLGLKILVSPLRHWDFKAAQRPDFFIANSTHIQSDIKQFYNRDSVVIYPPVNTERFTASKMSTRQGFITVGRQVPYKHVDLIVQTCSRLSLNLTVIGSGPEHQKLMSIAGPTVKFLDNASDEDVTNGLGRAEAFILAALEDFGITPVEALAAGTPVIAYKAGGALDYVQEGQTGMFFSEQTVDSLARVLSTFDSNKFDSKVIAEFAKQFDKNYFNKAMSDFIESKLKGKDE